MKNTTIHFIQHMIMSVKSGRSIEAAKKSFPTSKNKKSKNKRFKRTNIEYELQLIMEKGLQGFPVLKLLENLHTKSQKQLVFEMEKHNQKTPFLALIPLFLFQVPSLVLIFLYPMISNFIKELS